MPGGVNVLVVQPGGDGYAHAASNELVRSAALPCGFGSGAGGRDERGAGADRAAERIGTAKNPMPPAQMREKFFDCSAHAGVERPVAEKIAATLDRLGEQPSFAEFWPLLRRG